MHGNADSFETLEVRRDARA